MKRLYGNADLVWSLAIFGGIAVLVGLLTSHLRTEFEIYRLANLRAETAAETVRLQEEQRHLRFEKQVRIEQLHLDRWAESAGMTLPHPAAIEEIQR